MPSRKHTSNQSVDFAALRALKLGGRLVMPVGKDSIRQTLVRVTRTEVDQYGIEDLGAVQLVPLIGEQGWTMDKWDAHANASRRFR